MECNRYVRCFGRALRDRLACLRRIAPAAESGGVATGMRANADVFRAWASIVGFLFRIGCYALRKVPKGSVRKPNVGNK